MKRMSLKGISPQNHSLPHEHGIKRKGKSRISHGTLLEHRIVKFGNIFESLLVCVCFNLGRCQTDFISLFSVLVFKGILVTSIRFLLDMSSGSLIGQSKGP